jgi:hypothetical protein
MDQQNPTNAPWGTGSTGSMSGGSSSEPNLGPGTGSSRDTAGSGAFGLSSATDSGVCPTCGQSRNSGLEQFLGRLGITDDMIGNLKNQFQNVDVDEYMNTARDFLKNGSTKASTYAKENPGKVAAGVAALALGAGLIYAAVNRDEA